MNYWDTDEKGSFREIMEKAIKKRKKTLGTLNLMQLADLQSTKLLALKLTLSQLKSIAVLSFKKAEM